MPADRPSPTQKPVRGCQTFRSRSLPVHLAGYALGIAVWLAAYAGVVLVLGVESTVAAETPAGLAHRQVAAGVAGVAAGLSFAVAYAGAVGAPFPNLVAASGITAIAPARLLAFGGGAPTPRLVGADLVVATLVLAGGSAVTLLSVVAWYYGRFGGTATDAAERWEDAHFPPGFRLAVSGTDSAGIDWAQADYGLSEWRFWRFFANGAVVVTATFLLYGVVLGLQVLLGEVLVLQAVAETPRVLVTLAGVAYVWYLNHRWRTGVSG